MDSLALAGIAITSAASIVMQIIAALKEERRHKHRQQDRAETLAARTALQRAMEEIRDK